MSEYDGRKPEPPYPIVGEEDAAFVRAAWEEDVKAMGLDLDHLTTRNAALEAAHVQMQASLDAMAGEKSYLSDEVIPALKAEVESLAAENLRIRHDRLDCQVVMDSQQLEIERLRNMLVKAALYNIDAESTSVIDDQQSSAKEG